MANSASTYSISARFTGIDAVVSGFQRIKNAAGQASKSIEESSRANQKAWKGYGEIFGRIKPIGSQYGVGREIGDVWKNAAEGLKVYADAAMKLIIAQNKFKAINLSPAENERAFAAVKDTVGAIKGLNLAETTDLITDLHTAVGNLDHAIEALPIASKFKFGFSTLFGEKFGPEKIEEETRAAFRALEAMGVMQKGQAEIEKRFNVMAQMMSATGGRVTPSMLYAMTKTGNAAIRGLSVEGMRSLSAPLQELGPQRTGTALMSMYQAIIGGKIGQPAMKEFMRLGLLPQTKEAVEFTKAGLPKRIKPGAFGKFADALLEDPLKAADMLVEAMKKPMKGGGIDTSKATEIRKELAVLFGNRTAQGLMDILTTQRTQVVKESGLAQHAKSIEELYTQALDTPMGKIKQFESAIENLKTEIGLPLAQAFGNVASAAEPFIKMIGRHPELATFVLLVGALGTAVAKTAMLIRLSGLAGALKGLFGAGAAATTAVAEGGVQGLAGAGVAAGGLTAAGIATGIASTAGIALAVAAVGLVIKGMMDDASNREDAREIGERIARMISDGLQDTLDKDQTITRFQHAELLKARRKAIIGGLGEYAGTPGTEDFLDLAHYGQAVKLGQENLPGYGQRIKKRLADLNFQNVDELAAYLEGIRGGLKKHGELTSFPSIETAVLSRYPQFQAQYAEKFKIIDAAMGDTSTAAVSATEALRLLNEQIGRLGRETFDPIGPHGPRTTGGTAGSTGGGTGGGTYLPYSRPTLATGGHAIRGGLVRIHTGEDVLPAHVTSRLASGRALGGSHLNYSPTININGGSSDSRQQFAAMLDEHARHIERLLDESYKDARMSA